MGPPSDMRLRSSATEGALKASYRSVRNNAPSSWAPMDRSLKLVFLLGDMVSFGVEEELTSSLWRDRARLNMLVMLSTSQLYECALSLENEILMSHQ